MQIIPVLDLAGGVAVHAQAGDRSSYGPLTSDLVPDAPGDAVALLRAFHATSSESTSVTSLISTLSRAAHSSDRCFGSWPSFTPGLPARCWWTPAPASRAGPSKCSPVVPVRWWWAGDAAAPSPIWPPSSRWLARPDLVFSLDLRLGNPVLHPAMQDANGAGPDAVSLAEQATAAGVTTLLLLDLGRIGTGCGVDIGTAGDPAAAVSPHPDPGGRWRAHPAGPRADAGCGVRRCSRLPAPCTQAE